MCVIWSESTHPTVVLIFLFSIERLNVSKIYEFCLQTVATGYSLPQYYMVIDCLK